MRTSSFVYTLSMSWVLYSLWLSTGGGLAGREVAVPSLFSTAGAAPLAVALEPAFPNLRFDQPLFLTHAGDGSGRVFVVEKVGRVHVFANDPGVAASEVFLDVSPRLLPRNHPDVGETGLLSVAFHPAFSENGLFYVSYVDEDLVSVVSEWAVSPDSNRADPASERVLLRLQQPQRNHNGGHIAFGPDGYLYVAFGDGFSESSRDGIEHGDPLGHGQNPETWFSSMLRIDVDSAEGENAYAVPPDNPFVGNDLGWREEIYAYGFRNPWRFSFDRATGRLWLADVGDKKAEEIDIVEPGKNYGWSLKEGVHCFEDVPCDTTLWVGLEDPVYQYLRDVGESVTGGYVYRGNLIEELQGRYVYGDFDFRHVWALTYDGNAVTQHVRLATASGRITSFGEDEQGELYMVEYGGSVLRLTDPSTTAAESASNLHTAHRLLRNYPNPFQGSTSISFEIERPGEVKIAVWNLLGAEVQVVHNQYHMPGRCEVEWDGRDAQGHPMAVGVYVYTLEAGGVRTGRVMHLTK